MDKKSILFVNESLACAGGEKSLLNLLSVLDYDRYDVYLQLFKYGCPWDRYIDSRVKVLPALPYSKFTELSLPRAIVYAIFHGKINWFISRLKYSVALRRLHNLTNPDKAYLYWRYQSKCYKGIENKYDYVIAYAQGVPTFYVADKSPKDAELLAWINATYLPDNPCKEFSENRLRKFHVINAVSEPIKDAVSCHWPSLTGKMTVFRDLINPDMIEKMSKEKIDFEKQKGVLTLMTLGRLSPQKGYDITVEAANILKQKGVDFRWYILGGGVLEDEIRKGIKKYGLDDNLLLLGVKSNPYPYLKLADIYVQTSRLEGFGLAIAEARLLDIPVVTTRFNTVFMQMVDGKNGLVTDINGQSVAEAIICLYSNKDLYASIVDYLKQEPKGNLETISQFYQLLDH